MKRYLETPEAVIKALKEGKTVETDMKYYVLKDGVLNCYSKNKAGSWWTVNSAIYDSDRPYVEEPKPLKIEVGKFYKTRDGRKAFVCANTYTGLCWVVIIDSSADRTFCCTVDGKFCPGEENEKDLIAPWEK